MSGIRISDLVVDRPAPYQFCQQSSLSRGGGGYLYMKTDRSVPLNRVSFDHLVLSSRVCFYLSAVPNGLFFRLVPSPRSVFTLMPSPMVCFSAYCSQGSVFMPPFKEAGVSCFAQVCWSIRRSISGRVSESILPSLAPAAGKLAHRRGPLPSSRAPTYCPNPHP